MRRLFGFVPVFALASVMLAACPPPDPGYALRHNFSLSPGLQVGDVTSCLTRASQVSGRQHLCRVVHGYEEAGDARNWHIDAQPSSSTTARRILSMRGSNDSRYGYAVVLDNGVMFEGCRWYSPANDFDCDYLVQRHTVLRTNGTWDYVLRKAWDWFRYAGNTLGCAGGITSIWYGSVITLPTLTGCVDGPL